MWPALPGRPLSCFSLFRTTACEVIPHGDMGESEVGLVGRYYDPATGQFVNVDPLVDMTGQPYAYTGNDPVNGVHPDGLCNRPSGAFLVSGACYRSVRVKALVGTRFRWS
jgi:hypothetical protein